MPLELIIRPFQTRDITPPRLAPSAAPGDVGDPVKLEYGKSGGSRVLNGGANLQITYYSIKRPTEKTTPTAASSPNVKKDAPESVPPGYSEYKPPEYTYPTVLWPGSQVS